MIIKNPNQIALTQPEYESLTTNPEAANFQEVAIDILRARGINAVPGKCKMVAAFNHPIWLYFEREPNATS